MSMSKRFLIALCSASLLLGGIAVAQTSGSSSGPAAGKNVEPSAAVQKKKAHKKKAPMGAGAPGAESKPGSKGGAAPKSAY